jgi:hypothetical protein
VPEKNIRLVVARDGNIELERRYKVLTADLNYSPEVARLIIRDDEMWQAVGEYRYGPEYAGARIRRAPK